MGAMAVVLQRAADDVGDIARVTPSAARPVDKPSRYAMDEGH